MVFVPHICRSISSTCPFSACIKRYARKLYSMMFVPHICRSRREHTGAVLQTGDCACLLDEHCPQEPFG